MEGAIQKSTEPGSRRSGRKLRLHTSTLGNFRVAWHGGLAAQHYESSQPNPNQGCTIDTMVCDSLR